jgi:hypothetical protein
MSDSFKEMTRVPSELLQQRISTVHELRQDELELYEISKDSDTGEHYLHYAYVHRNLAAIGPGAGEEEVFHHLMPLDSDAVLGMMFGEQSYSYPDFWDHAFLRNGPEGDYVWFDPTYVNDHDESEMVGRSIVEELQRFKQSGERSEEALRKLLESFDPPKKE